MNIVPPLLHFCILSCSNFFFKTTRSSNNLNPQYRAINRIKHLSTCLSFRFSLTFWHPSILFDWFVWVLDIEGYLLLISWKSCTPGDLSTIYRSYVCGIESMLRSHDMFDVSKVKMPASRPRVVLASSFRAWDPRWHITPPGSALYQRM